MSPAASRIVLAILLASVAACSESTSPGDDGTPVTVSLGSPSTVPLLAASTERLYTLRGVDPTSIAVEARRFGGGSVWKSLVPSCQDACFLAADALDNVYFATATGVTSVNGETGAVRWDTPVRSAAIAVGSSRHVYVVSRPFAVPQRAYSIDAGTGAIEWITTLLPGFDATALLLDESRSVLYAIGRGRVTAMNLDGGAVRWISAANCFGGSQGAIASDGTIYVTCDNDLSSRLFAYHPSGLAKWTASLGATNGTLAPVIDAAGIIYVANRGSLSAVRPEGGFLWQMQNLGNSTTSPAVGSNNDVYLHASSTSGAPPSLLVINAGSVVEDKGPLGCALAFLVTMRGRVYCGSSGGFAFFQTSNTDVTGQWSQMGSDAQRGSRKP
jgi:outer membrane protein assembly factor BamB